MITIAFHPRHIEEIENKSKRLTARINFERQVRQGGGLRFIDSSNSQIFGHGICMDVYTMPTQEFIDTDWEYHRTYRGYGEWKSAFNEYYPDVDLNTIDDITVIEWGDTFTPNRFYDG